VLAAVSDARLPLSVTEIAQRCELPVPTVHRLVAQLESLAMLRRAVGSKKLVVGPALTRLARSALESAMVGDATHRIVAGLASEIGEHCQIGLRVDNEVLYVDTARSNRSEGLHFEPGRRSPLHCTSIGKLFLADMPEGVFQHWLAHTPLLSQAPRTIVVPDELVRVIREVRRDEWAASNEELAPGVVGCAVPIRDAGGALVAGLGISVPSARVPFTELVRFRARMEVAARSVGEALEG
jgi:IclR family acetate operon transcriptional repressor